ncbi:MAG TPA: response regulator [Terriglobales bacterium]|nr:response regulator [Terriglobales bacterium]
MNFLETATVRILIVDDFEPWRRFLRSTLQKYPEYRVIGEVSDGVEAVRKARELLPDLILLDIGLPTVSGIEAARQIREFSPKSKILFVSENRFSDIATEVLRMGAGGYVVKSDAGSELLPAVGAVLRDKQFVSASVIGYDATDPPNVHTVGLSDLQKATVAPITVQNVQIVRHHEIGFYSDDQCLLDAITQFIGAALRSGNSTIVIATESHRGSLLRRLQASALNIGAAIEQGRYIALDAAETLSTLMLNGMPHPVRFFELLSDLIVTAAKAATGEHPRVAIFGECVQLLWAQGNTEAVVQLEKLGNQLAKVYDVGILCGYSLGSFQGGIGSYIFERICAEHSAVYTG